MSRGDNAKIVRNMWNLEREEIECRIHSKYLVLSACLSVHLSACLSVYLSACLSASPSACLSVCLSVCQPACLPEHLHACSLSVCLPVCQPVHLPAWSIIDISSKFDKKSCPGDKLSFLSFLGKFDLISARNECKIQSLNLFGVCKIYIT